jgi:hypothetical protein
VFVVVAGLFLLSSAGALTGALLNGGPMGMGATGQMMGTGWSGGLNWWWLPTGLTLVLGIVIGWMLLGKRHPLTPVNVPPTPPTP